MLAVGLVLLCCGAAFAQPAKGLNELGVMAFQAKRYPQALEHFTRALKLEPENPVVRRNLCGVYQAMANDLATEGKFGEALGEMLKGIGVDPQNADALAQAGSYALKAGRREEALAQLEAAKALAPENAEILALYGEACYQMDRSKEAQSAWEAALALRPEWPELQQKLEKLTRESSVEADFNAYTSAHFHVRYAKALSEETRAAVFALLEEAYQSIGERLGGVYPADAVPVVLYDGDQFTEATDAPVHVGALYDGKIRAPITDQRGRFLSPRVLKVRLTHEYVHVALVGYVGNERLPWWLNEGLAETFSREMDLTRRRQLGRLAHGDGLRPLEALEKGPADRTDPKQLANWYAQAHATAAHLWEQGGAEKLAALIQRLRAGDAAEASLRAVYGLDYAALNRAVGAAYGGTD